MENSGFINNVLSTINKHFLLAGNETVLVGLSGGPDSVCLLHVLNEIKEKLNLKICAVYVDHNLRPRETPGEIELCRNLCERLSVSFIVRSVDVKAHEEKHGLNRQEAARELRYRVFDETAITVNAQKIALAHNADDQVETLFMRILRGSGPAGLSGIPVKRGNIIRPLLESDRIAVEDYLHSKNVDSLVDSSNLGTDYVRNRMRLTLLPELKRINPRLTHAVIKMMTILAEEERYFDILVTRVLMKMISRKSVERIELFLAPMESMDVVILRRVLRRAISEIETLRGISFVQIEEIIRLVKKGKSGDRLYLPRGIRVIREYSLLTMTSEEPFKLTPCRLDSPGDVVIRGAGMVLKASFEQEAANFGNGSTDVLLDGGLMTFPLKIRHRLPGDFFFPLGFGKKKKLQDFFVDEKIPRDERDGIPIVVSGSDIVWIAGHRADERFRITEHTHKFLRLGIVKGGF